MRYNVFLVSNGIRSQHEPVLVDADDMHIEIGGGEDPAAISINFTKNNDEGDVITVGIFPFAEIAYAIVVDS